MTMHECILKAERDPFALSEQWILLCQCHMGSTYKTWRPGDPDVTCPEGTVLNKAVPVGEGKR